MFPTRFKNRHCRNYAPVDFDTGFCHFHQIVVLAEGDTCQYFDRFPRCQNCQNYTSSVAGYLGMCQARRSNDLPRYAQRHLRAFCVAGEVRW